MAKSEKVLIKITSISGGWTDLKFIPKKFIKSEKNDLLELTEEGLNYVDLSEFTVKHDDISFEYLK